MKQLLMTENYQPYGIYMYIQCIICNYVIVHVQVARALDPHQYYTKLQLAIMATRSIDCYYFVRAAIHHHTKLKFTHSKAKGSMATIIQNYNQVFWV